MIRCPVARQAEKNPQKSAVVQGDFHLSYLKLHRWVSAVAKRLSKISSPSLAFSSSGKIGEIVLLFAALRAGKFITPINNRFPEQAKESSLARLGISNLYHVPHIPEEGSWTEEQLTGELRLFTSGSSGRPKIAAILPQALLANAEGAIEALHLDQTSCWRLSLPLFHVGGIAILFRCFRAGALVEIPNNEKSCATHLSFVPTQLYRALQQKELPPPELRCLLMGGALL